MNADQARPNTAVLVRLGDDMRPSENGVPVAGRIIAVRDNPLWAKVADVMLHLPDPGADGTIVIVCTDYLEPVPDGLYLRCFAPPLVHTGPCRSACGLADVPVTHAVSLSEPVLAPPDADPLCGFLDGQDSLTDDHPALPITCPDCLLALKDNEGGHDDGRSAKPQPELEA